MASDRLTDPAGQPRARGASDSGSPADKAKHAAERAAEEAGRQASSALEDARSAADRQSHKAKDYAAGSFSETAEALGKVAGEMPDGSVRHELLREASEGLGQIARSLESRSVGELARGLSDFGRRNPAAFLGGATLVGLALARFVRASESEAPQPEAGSYGAAPRYGTQTGSAPLGGSATPSPAAGQPEPAPGSTSPGSTGPGPAAPPATPRTATEI